jgi:hypothetical protein
VPERVDATVALVAVKLERLQIELLEPRHEIPLLRIRDDIGYVSKAGGKLLLSEQILHAVDVG